MNLFSFEYAGRQFALVGVGANGEEQLLIDGQPVSSAHNQTTAGSHAFELADRGAMRLDFQIDGQRGQVNYALYEGQQLVLREAAPLTARAPSDASTAKVVADSKFGHGVSFVGIFFKLMKSAKVVKVVLAGLALASWSLLFSWQFGLVLLGVIVFHEYGHLRAMQKCGMKTKGIYLIPFVGGVAVGERAESHWHEVYISMMGPVFGLLMSVVFYVMFLASDNHFLGLVASISALINLFNLLPVYPLDGGHVVKSLVLSGQRAWSFTLLIALSAVCFALALAYGLSFLSFFIVLGAIDLLASRSQFAAHPQTPLDRNGIWYCTLWYFVVVAAFIAIIVAMANTGVPGTEVATSILKS
jgi:Zn-dependent protease